MKTNWNDSQGLFESHVARKEKPVVPNYPIVKLDKNYNNKLAATYCFFHLVVDSEFYQVGKTYEIQVLNKRILDATIEQKIIYPYHKLTDTVARIDRGVTLQEYLKQMNEEQRGRDLTLLKFALIVFLILPNKQ